LLIGLKKIFFISKLLESSAELKKFFVGVKVLYCKSRYRNKDDRTSNNVYASLGVLPGAILAI
jgi:hypothetical protein